MQFIPTRIPGAGIYREAVMRRADGSSLLIRRPPTVGAVTLPHEEVITADFGFLSEPSFSLLPVSRSLRCLEGQSYVCLVDVRVNSPSFGRWQSFCLREDDARTLSVPHGVACGWQVTSGVATVERRFSRELDADRWYWLKWNDGDLQIAWPEPPMHLENHLRPSRRLSRLPASRLPGYLPVEAARKPARDSEPSSRQDLNVRPAARVSDLPINVTPVALPACPRPQSDPPPAPHPPLSERRNSLILVIGSSGQLGRDLCRHLRGLGTVVGACRSPDKGSLLPVPVYVDISRPASLRQAIRQVRPSLIINAAGLSDPDVAESNPRLAQLVNATAPAIIADEALRIGAGLIHFCSSMVFDGSGDTPRRETDPTDPQNQYARTKLLGTNAVAHSDVPSMILRGGWFYATHGDNYVRRMIDSLGYRSCVTLPADYYGCPTSTDWLARTLTDILRGATGNYADWLTRHGGLYHVGLLGHASQLEVGDQVLAVCKQLGLPTVVQNLRGCSIYESPSRAAIPPNCRLDPARFAMNFGLELPRWQEELRTQIARMLGEHPLGLHSVA